MSRLCSISIDLQTAQHSRLDLLLLLVEQGWRFDGLYLPPNDRGMFDWQDRPADQWSQLCSTLKQIEKANELIGVSFQWQDTGIGGTFHIDPTSTDTSSKRLWIVLGADRPRLIDAYWFTDYGWYLKRILPAFWQADVYIASVQCQDVY